MKKLKKYFRNALRFPDTYGLLINRAYQNDLKTVKNYEKTTIKNLSFFRFCKNNVKIKLILFLLLFSFLGVHASPNSKPDLLTLHLEKVSIENVFAEIEKNFRV